MNESREQFTKAAKDWLCESCCVDIRYVAEVAWGGHKLIHSLVNFYPWVSGNPSLFEFQIDAADLVLGQRILVNSALPETLRVLEEALSGEVSIGDNTFSIKTSNGTSFVRENPTNEWTNQLRSMVIAGDSNLIQLSPTVDDELRRASIPFDGLVDAVSWLGIPNFRHDPKRSIRIIVNAPAEIIINESRLFSGELKLVVNVHDSVDLGTVGLALIGYPPKGVSMRRQISGDIKWKNPDEQHRVRGEALIPLPQIGSVLIALSIGSTYVQRQYFVDPATSMNIRYIAVQQFDRELRRVQSQLSTNDSRSFEKAVASLLFMSGFASMLPLESDGPDIITVTPGGQLVLVECTVKTTDGQAKIGNLVSRREALSGTFKLGGHNAPVLTVLVCQSPRVQIAMTDVEFAKHDVLLLASEDLAQHLASIKNFVDPDEICVRGRAKLERLRAAMELSASGSGFDDGNLQLL
jgi:hypothetical protein